MKVLERLSGLFRKGGGAGKSDLQANMQKALHMKQESGSQAHIPPHQTPGEGMKVRQDPNRSEGPGAEGGFTPELKRSRVARSGDT
jgi:hypothetical protein